MNIRNVSEEEVRNEIDHIVDWIRNWFSAQDPNSKVVVEVCGDRDSSVTIALLCKAIGPERIYGAHMPNWYGDTIAKADDIIRMFGIRSKYMAIAPVINMIEQAVYSPQSEEERANPTLHRTMDAHTNIPERIRTAILYMAAESIIDPTLVANICNRSDLYINNYAKYGRTAGDFSLLQYYTVTEIVLLGQALGIPASSLEEKPNWMGIPYTILDRYLLEGKCSDKEMQEKIEARHKLGMCITKPIPCCPNIDRYLADHNREWTDKKGAVL